MGKKRFAGALAAVAFAAGVGHVASGATPATRAASPAAFTRSCSAGYVTAHLSWGVKCLRAGEFCKVGNSEYRKYGFYCPATGHLRRR